MDVYSKENTQGQDSVSLIIIKDLTKQDQTSRYNLRPIPLAEKKINRTKKA